MSIRNIFLTLTLLLLTTSCYDSHQEPSGNSSHPRPNITIAELRSRASTRPVVVEAEATIEGVVISDDAEGNIRRTLFIDDGTAATELMMGRYDLHVHYPLGLRLAFDLQGCAIAITDGVLQIGLKAESYSLSAVDYLYSQVVIDQHTTSLHEITTIEPYPLSLDNFAEALCGRLVRVGPLQRAPIDERDNELSEGSHRYIDTQGNAIYLVIDPLASFATHTLPEHIGSAVGILSYGSTGYGDGACATLRPRYLSDYEN